jgi:flagellar biosynthesis/type III secretory pathway protein FliH
MTRVIRCDQSPRVVPALVGDATLHARLIIERAQAQTEQLRSEASAEGRAQGLATLSAAFAELAAARDRELAALEAHAIQIALCAAKQIVGEELALSPERITSIVAPLIARLRRASVLTLRLHPEDAAFVQHHASEVLASSSSKTRIQIEADPAIARGGCLVVSDIGSLDARLESRLDLMGRAMLASLTDSAGATTPKNVDER